MGLAWYLLIKQVVQRQIELDAVKQLGHFFAILAATKSFRRCLVEHRAETCVNQVFFAFLFFTLQVFFVLALDFPFPALTLQLIALAVVVFTPQVPEFPQKFLHKPPAFLGIGDIFQHLFGMTGQFRREDAGQPATDFQPIRLIFQIIGSFDHPVQFFTRLLMPKPFLMAALLPFGQILFGDGPSAELFFEDFLHAWQFIEPLHQFLARFTILQPAAQIVADGFGQSPDFSNVRVAHDFSAVATANELAVKFPQGRGFYEFHINAIRHAGMAEGLVAGVELDEQRVTIKADGADGSRIDQY